jgi:hypothetical protein
MFTTHINECKAIKTDGKTIKLTKKTEQRKTRLAATLHVFIIEVAKQFILSDCSVFFTIVDPKGSFRLRAMSRGT